MEAKTLEEIPVSIEMNMLSAQRTSKRVNSFAQASGQTGVKKFMTSTDMVAYPLGVDGPSTFMYISRASFNTVLDGAHTFLVRVRLLSGIPSPETRAARIDNRALLAAQGLNPGNIDIKITLIKCMESFLENIRKANSTLKSVADHYKSN